MPSIAARTRPTLRHGGWWRPVGAASHRPDAPRVRPWRQGSRRAHLCHRSSLRFTPQDESSGSKSMYQRPRAYRLSTTSVGWRLGAMSTMSSQSLRDAQQRASSWQADEGYSSTLQRRRQCCSRAGGATGNTSADN